MTAAERQIELDRRTTARVRRAVAAGRTSTELFETLGMTGTPGFMGRGSFSTTNRTAGYRRTR